MTRRATLPLALFLAVFAARFGYFLHSRPYRAEPDGTYGRMYEMEAAADSLARTGAIRDVLGPGTGPSAHVAPLYAFYLAALDRLAGLDVGRFRFYHGLGAILATSLFAALLPGFAARAGLSRGVGLGAACLVAANPTGLWMETRGDWETATLPLALMALARALMALQDRGWSDPRRSAGTGVLFGLGGLLSPVVLLAGLAGLFGQGVDPKVRSSRIVRSGAVLLAACALTISPWVLRNYAVFSAFVPIRDNLGIELAIGNNSDSDGTTFGPGLKRHPIDNPDEQGKLRALGEVAYNRARLAEAKSWIAAHPSRFAGLTASRALRFWFPSDRSMISPMPGLSVRVQAVPLVATSILGLVGLARMVRSGHRYRAILAALILAPSLPYLFAHVSYRYRYPINGFVALLACEALALAFARARGFAKRRDPYVGQASACLPTDLSAG